MKIVSRVIFLGFAADRLFLGLYSIQEAAAQIPVTLFSSLKNKLVLDSCAAPGGKAVQLADLMENTGEIIALDINQHRLTALSNQLERCHVSNALVYCQDARKVSQLGLKFDCVLLDVPCSGNFSTDPLWFRRRTIKDIESNASHQREILSAAVDCSKEDGEIVYSTCSLEPEENEANIDWALSHLPVTVEEVSCFGQEGLTLVLEKNLDPSIACCKRIWPGQTQGFFACKMRKVVRKSR